MQDGVYQLQSGYNASFMLPFEDFDELRFYRWLAPNWTQCLWYSLIYVIAIFSGKHFMHKRERFEIRGALTLWNLCLAIFSICAAIRMNQEMVYVLRTYGWEYSICVPSYGQAPFGLWVMLFAVSKVVEFGDTVFIVLRKQPLIFLHWYHHIATLIYVWVAYPERMSSGRWFITMNCTVHAFMYTYYAFRAMKFRIPRPICIAITSMQTFQMVIGITVNVGVILVKQRGDHCQQSWSNLVFSSLMYFSYFLLFSVYFYNAYVAPKKVPKVKLANKPYQNGTKKAN